MYATLSRMKPTPSRRRKQGESWPREVQPGRATVRVYRRKTPSGNWAFMVSNYADGARRRFDCYKDEADAIEAAEALAKRLDSRDYVAASMTRDQAIEYANADRSLEKFGISVSAGASALAECLKIVGDLSALYAAAKSYSGRQKHITKKLIQDVVNDFLVVKEGRNASDRYLRDLKGRLNRFAGDCNKNCCNVTTADLQDWLDKLKLSPQSYRNYRTVLHILFRFAVAKGYAAENPVESVEQVKVRNGDVEIFTPAEISRLLNAAEENSPDFVPCLAIGAFAGLRSAEIERLEWKDIDLPSRHIIVSASKAKTASRRIVPIHDNLVEWLAPFAAREGKIWSGGWFYKHQQSVASLTAVEANPKNSVKAQKPVAWKQNALRHSYASYRFAQTGDAGRVAGELGNSANVVHRHYRELVKPVDAEKWFSVRPGEAGNIIHMTKTGMMAAI